MLTRDTILVLTQSLKLLPEKKSRLFCSEESSARRWMQQVFMLHYIYLGQEVFITN
ncbi:9126_t:CDS:2 [Gigaspora margarita]|uniref:9126_t:CDS:1 n=1 Tax=Gigaspora margarita TaxID=4874 RepID=A0ABN7UJ49_GIGMA|nr:9126_t:CDS:2 [Gigaspora margarita]